MNNYDYDSYINTIDVIEDSIDDNSKFPIVRDTKLKQICRMVLEFFKIIIYYLKFYINVSQKSKTKDE